MMLFHATNRPRRTGFSLGDPRYEDSGSARCRLQKSTAWKFHSLPRRREAAPHVSGKSYTVYRRLERVHTRRNDCLCRLILRSITQSAFADGVMRLEEPALDLIRG